MTWRTTLRQYREEFIRDKDKLQQASAHHLSKDQLQEVEHLQNQLHIQLINIHDLKQHIKTHCRIIESETGRHHGQLRDETVAEHENIYDDYQRLTTTLEELKDEFNNFMNRV